MKQKSKSHSIHESGRGNYFNLLYLNIWTGINHALLLCRVQIVSKSNTYDLIISRNNIAGCSSCCFFFVFNCNKELHETDKQCTLFFTRLDLQKFWIILLILDK